VATWRAEREVDAALVRELLGQFPELAGASLRPLSEGWDRSVWLVDESFVFGFPRREVALEGLQREIAFLPRLAPLVPLPIPVPTFVGGPTAAFPWPFTGSAFVSGSEAVDVVLDDATRTQVGVDVARFLRRLHSVEVAEALGADALPRDPNGRSDMQKRAPWTHEVLSDLERLGLWRRSAETVAMLRDAEQLERPAEGGTVAHGDLHFRHVLVEDGRASGVLDWIDLCRADPAIDLQLYWSFLPPSGRPAFAEAYGPISDEQLLRARVLALFLAAESARYGHAEGHEKITTEALAGLRRTLAG
jgi:aminoglycoside phosphotransferase (APT) family kinase protein